MNDRTMRVDFTRTFHRQYDKLPFNMQRQFDTRLRLFLSDQSDPRLRVHPLKGKFVGYWSMNVSGDIRALYVIHGDDLVIFALIGSHSQLYG